MLRSPHLFSSDRHGERAAGGPTARRRVAGIAVVAALVLAACSGDDSGHVGSPEQEGGPLGAPTDEDLARIAEEAASVATIDVPDGFVVPDSRSVALPVLEPADDAEQPSQQVPIPGGDSTLVVDVVGPGGDPVPGATVLFERFANGGVGTRQVGTNNSGRASLSNILGGRYRVRAWLSPRLTATEAEVTFLRADDQELLRVELQEFEGYSVNGELHTSQWAVGQSAAFEVVVVEQAVGADGIVRGAPVVADVQIALSSGLRIAGASAGAADDDEDDDNGDDANGDDDDGDDGGGTGAATTEVRTAGDGRAVWTLTCESPGAHTVSIVAVEETTTIDLPPCTAEPAPPPEPPDAPDAEGEGP